VAPIPARIAWGTTRRIWRSCAARWTGANHQVNVAWADNRDVPPAQCDLTPGPGTTNSIGNRNQNIYADHLTVAP
jgi:hypothetical protein